jgi:hypothetical protein
MIVASLAPGNGCSPVTTCTLSLIVVVEIQHDAHLVCDHSKCVDVALLSWVAVRHTKAGGVQKFGCHVSNGAHGRGRHATGVDVIWIGCDRNESIVGEARVEIAVDDDVRL